MMEQPISLNIIKSALRDEDIEGLLAQGALVDEYDSEAEAILTAWQQLKTNERTSANLTAIVTVVWRQFFHREPAELDMRFPAFQNVARRIFESNT